MLSDRQSLRCAVKRKMANTPTSEKFPTLYPHCALNQKNTVIMWKMLKSGRNPVKWVLICYYSMRAFQWIPTWQDCDDFQKFLSCCAYDKSRLGIERVNSSNVVATFLQRTKRQRFLKNILNPIMLVLIGKLSDEYQCAISQEIFIILYRPN